MTYNLKIKTLLVLIFFAVVISCSQENNEIEEEVVTPTEEEEIFNYTSQAKYNLNIIYFIPNDIENLNESHRRLSEIFLHGQNFYKENMNEYGFGNKTYNLKIDEDKQRVKITYINGKFSTSNYPYEGGGAIIKEEVEAYFTSNSEEFDSDHTIVIVPVEDEDNPDVPFYGWGRWCFALDYVNMDVKYFKENSKKGRDATKYIGGLLHELGHGLNLPHNKQKYSESNNAEKGTSLMGSGNYTYGNTPTFLTKASCAILNNNQIFNNSESISYGGASLQIESIQAVFENGEIKLSGKFETDVEVNYIGYYNDPADDNADYDAVTWAEPVVNGNEFSVVMPIYELHKKGDTPYVLRLRFCHVNGEISTLSYGYTFSNNEPKIEFGDKNYLDRSKWEVISYSSEEDDGLASFIIDNNPATFWHSNWKQDASSYPHNIVIDMNEELTVEGFSFLQRDGMRKVKDVEILISADNENWQSQGNFTLKNINTIHHINLPKKETFRYFKIIAKSAFDGEQFAAMAEIKCF